MAQLLFIFTFLIVFAVNIIAQPNHAIQKISANDLPFREVLTSFELEDGIIWMVLQNHICRNNGHEVECFPFTTQRMDGAFIVNNRYIVAHVNSRKSSIYFDTKTLTFEELNLGNNKSLILQETATDTLYFVEGKNLFYFDFKSKTAIKLKRNSPFIDAPKSIKYATSDKTFVQFLEDKITVNGKTSSVPAGDAIGYCQAFSTSEGLIINNGKTIFIRRTGQFDFEKIYTDEHNCKRLFADQSGHLLLNIHKINNCKYSEKILLFDSVGKNMKNWSKLIPMDFDSTIAHIGGRDFFKKTLISSYHGFVVMDAAYPGIRKDMDVVKSSGFGRILRGITTDNKGNLWSSGEVKNLYKLNPNMVLDSFPITLTIGDSSQVLKYSRNLVFDSQRNWLWNTSGSYVKNESILYAWDIKEEKIAFSKAIPFRIWSMIEHERSLLLSSSSHLIFRFDMDNQMLDTLIVFNKDSLPEFRILMVEESTLYVGGKGGLWEYDLSTKKINEIEFFRDKQIYSITKKDKSLIVGSSDGLWLYDLDAKTYKHFNVENGLSNNQVTACHVVNRNRLLVATEGGINLIDLNYNLVTVFKVENGISDNECNFISSYADPKNAYFGTINGLTTFDLTQFSKSNNSKAIIYKTIEAGFNRKDKFKYGKIEEIVFQPDIQNLKIFLESEIKSSNVRYAYRYRGIDSAWIQISGNVIEILRPADRNCILEIICTDDNGVWSNSTISLSVKVKVYWYQSPWFYIILSSFISFLLFKLLQIQEKRKRDREVEIDRINFQATESKLAALQSQMNPHFLFNAISSIQYFINKRELQEADDYLSRFSSLIRKTLDSSRKKTITLAEEIEMLKLYTTIEEKRFGGKFNTIFEVDEDIEEDFVQIPPMLTQPLIENAINHGLMHIVGRKGELIISVSQPDENIIIKVIDNGLGLKEQYVKDHKSLALTIIDERIKAYAKSKEFTIEFSLYANVGGPGATSELRIKPII